MEAYISYTTINNEHGIKIVTSDGTYSSFYRDGFDTTPFALNLMGVLQRHGYKLVFTSVENALS